MSEKFIKIMKKILLFIGIFCCFSIFVCAQTEARKSVITLKNGKVFTGEIVAKNESTVVFKTDEGARYQFPVADIESIKQQSIEVKSNTEQVDKVDLVDNQADVGILLGAGSDYVFKSKGIGGAAALSADLALGIRNIAGQNWFVGLGVGYENIFTSPDNISLIQIFVKTQKIFSDNNKISPFTSLDLGYSLISNTGWKGGMFGRVKGGLSIKLGQRVVFLLGLNVSVQGCKTTLSQTQNSEIYHYNGSTFLPAIGFSAGIVF